MYFLKLHTGYEIAYYVNCIYSKTMYVVSTEQA